MYALGGMILPDHYWGDGCPSANEVTSKCFECSESKWVDISPMKTPRMSGGMVTLGTCYAQPSQNVSRQ